MIRGSITGELRSLVAENARLHRELELAQPRRDITRAHAERWLQIEAAARAAGGDESALALIHQFILQDAAAHGAVNVDVGGLCA